MRDLTARQEQCLRILARCVANGLPPTLREIGSEMGIRSTNGVHDHLRALARRGLIEFSEGAISRGIRLTPAGRALTGIQAAPSAHRILLLEELYRCALSLRWNATGHGEKKLASVAFEAALDELSRLERPEVA